MSARIIIDSEVCGGRPIVAGTRMRVVDVLDAFASGDTIDELVADFPYLTREEIQACLDYASGSAPEMLNRSTALRLHAGADMAAEETLPTVSRAVAAATLYDVGIPID